MKQYAIAVRDGASLFLFMSVKWKSGEFFALLPRPHNTSINAQKNIGNRYNYTSERDIELREEFVFNQFAERKIPIAYMHGGGYFSEETVSNFHYMTAKAAIDSFAKFLYKA
jgi:hypothetical protein